MSVESEETLCRMSAAQGGAAANGFVMLLRTLLERGIIGEDVVIAIRDDMLMDLDPSVADAADRGIQLAYKNTLVQFSFLSAARPQLMEPDSDGAKALGPMIAGM